MNLPAKQEPTDLIRTTVSGQIQIRHLKNTVPIEQALPVCFQSVGLRPKHWPSKSKEFPEWQFLLDFIKENYGGLVAKELILAFKLAAQHKLPLKKDEVSPYDNFSPEYLGRILSAYNQYKAKCLQGKIKPLPLPEKKLDRKLYYQEELFKPYAKLLKGQYVFSSVDEVYLYRSIDALGIEIATLEEKLDFMKEARENLEARYRETPREKETRIKDRARSMCFQTWIKGLALNETDIKPLILSKLKE